MVVHAAVGAPGFGALALPFQCSDALRGRVRSGADAAQFLALPAVPCYVPVLLALVASCWLLYELPHLVGAEPTEVEGVQEPVGLEENLHVSCGESLPC